MKRSKSAAASRAVTTTTTGSVTTTLEQGESIRSYVKCFLDTRATIPNVVDDDIINYFQSGITVQSLYHDFGRNRPKTVVELRDMMQH